MKTILKNPAYSLKDFRILPSYTDETHKAADVSLRTPLCRCGADFIHLNLPFLSAAMHAVTGIEMATTLSTLGGVGVLPLIASIEEQCRMVRAVKRYKAGFQTDILTFSPEQKIRELRNVMEKTSYSIFPVTDSGLFHGRLMGVITDKDFDPRFDLDRDIKEKMKTALHVGVEVDDLKEANRLMIEYGRGFLPIVTREGTLQSVVFKKDMDRHIRHPEAAVDARKRHLVGAAVSTHPEDRARIEALVQSDVDFLVIDASDGFTVFQKETLQWIKHHFTTPAIAGNIVTGEAFQMLAELKADAVKIGMGIGSGCTTQEVKATGRGQATAIMEIAKARNEYYKKTNTYIPLIADGGINSPIDIAVALALGADSVMMGNFFARFAESPGKLVKAGGKYVKEYWMEGSRKAFNLRRYHQSAATFFEEGVVGYVPYEGSIFDAIPVAGQRLKATLSTAGVSNIRELHENAVLELQTITAREAGGIHDMTVRRCC
ncbi:MAG: IMP dehydrogenase [Deltaproteobacteria bacterium]|nr:IMP dehydrogenase [Deltaproteobacteria bacterium]